jgi:hypothetical protein
MKYLMLVVADPDVDDAEEPLRTIEEWVDETARSGVNLDGDRLRPPSHAKTIRRRGGKVVVTDGPFAETHEWIAGFDLLECDTLEQAIEVASLHPMATHGIIELRPVWPFGAD